MKPKKTVYYSDPLNDDFAGTNIRPKTIGGDFRFINPRPLWKLGSFMLYYGVACPIVWLYTHMVMGMKIENRRALRKLKKTGFFLYGNHTQLLDPLIPPMVTFPKRAYTVASPDAVSIRFLKNIVLMLGAIPIPTDFSGMQKYISAIDTRCAEKSCIAIYPEAHVWPYYTGIRPFRSASFRYPAKLDVPVVAMVTTYRKRRGLLRFLKRPAVTVTLSEPFYPDASLGIRKAQEKLCCEVYDFMIKTSAEKENVEYIRYEWRPSA